MERFIPYEKLSKKKKRELDAMKRGSWGGLNPVTRRPENPKAYNRMKAQGRKDRSDFEPFYLFESLHRVTFSLYRPGILSAFAQAKIS